MLLFYFSRNKKFILITHYNLEAFLTEVKYYAQ